MESPYQLDTLDRKILMALKNNARIPYLEIARICNVSGSSIHQRIEKMEKKGIIKGSTVLIDYKGLGYHTCAFIGVFLDKGNSYRNVSREIEAVPEVVECHYTTGGYTMFLKIYARDNHHLMEILNGKIQNIKGVTRTETYISLEQYIDRQVSLVI